jgi:ubiquinone/menaquinone biosynthesis C-methylase UbiE
VKSKVEKIFEEVKEKYLQPEELEEWTNIVEEGLTLYEKKYIKKYVDKREKLLDIGCGGGREGIALASNGHNVFGVDLVVPMVINARKTAEKMNLRLKYLVMNALSLGFKNNTFNGVLMLGQVLAFVPLRENRIKVLREAYRVLKPGGKILLTTHSRNSHLKYKIYFFVKDHLRRILKQFGFDTLEPGDRFTTTVGNAKSKGKHYLHMYSMKEIINNSETPKQREKDYYLIYAAEKVNTMLFQKKC